MASTNRQPDASREMTWDVSENTTALQSKFRGKLREPPPTLFLHPSSGASHVSLPGIMAPGASVLGASSLRGEASTSVERTVPVSLLSRAKSQLRRPASAINCTESNCGADRTDALWAEMQATLEEVELSASGGTHVFGPGHGLKLAQLRSSQIALAQAWARSEADDAIETALRANDTTAPVDEVRNLKGAWVDAARSGSGEAADPSANARPESRGDAGADRFGSKWEEETEMDILLARNRREANDQYFKRVNNGVIDVVSKLEYVAKAMRAVEQDSRDVWNETVNTSDHEIN
ncbi:hypothetical protein CDD83_4922 [Cordyceps sp. RAO-2017]|nr:hypothetical protein CDD83_4922 [Cordyceps sp. RAO-2017]